MHDDAAHAMSEALGPALQQAADKCLAENGGGMCTSFITLINYMDSDGAQLWSFVVSPGQLVTQSAGMVRVIDKIVDQELTEAMFGDDSQY